MIVNPYVRLTVWYVALLMAISLAFSVWVYGQTTSELRSEWGSGPVIAKITARYGPVPLDLLHDALERQYSESQQRIIVRLVLLNIGVLVTGAGASYWLARLTMRPIEDALEAQNRFTADASHELRTPLAAMKTEIEVALRDPNLTKEEMKELLQSNLEETDRMGALAQGLLTLARSTDAPPLIPVSAERVAEAVAKRLQPLADAKKITIKKELHKLKVIGDAKDMDAIVCVLLDNAIKYSPGGSTIILSTSRQDGHGLITVKDEGAGISAEDLPHIFERFYRADSSRTKGPIAGHGLGLSIAQKLAANLRGAIIASSRPKVGSIFSLRLPVAS